MNDRVHPSTVIFGVALLAAILGLTLVATAGVAAENTTQVDVDLSNLSGDGSQSDPYEISNASELQAMEDDLNAYYELVADINASGTSKWNDQSGFDPIGNWSSTDSQRFNGSFNGNNHTISELYIDRQSNRSVGLFSELDSGGVIRNVNLEKVRITGGDSQYISGNDVQVGGLVGYNRGTINNTRISGSINGSWQVGGIAGINNGPIRNSSASGPISITSIGDSSTSTEAGGLVGRNYDSIRYSAAVVSIDNSAITGGAIGRNSGEIRNVSASGYMSGGNNTGGLVGYNNAGTVQDTQAAVEVNGGNNTGGLVGQNDRRSTVLTSFADSTVQGESNVGGLVGENRNNITNSYSISSVSGSERIGGLVGSNRENVTTSFAAGNVDGSGTVGGLIGETINTESYSNPVADSYWDENLTGQSSSDGGTKLSTANMTGESAVNNMTGLNFETVWKTQVNDYPDLIRPTIKDIAAPTADAGSNQTVSNGTVVAFNATSSSDNFEIVSYEWDLGDGSATTGVTPSHTYDSPGQYTAMLTVTDGAGNTATDTVVISVTDTTAPTADAGSNQTVDNGTAVTFDATGSTDNVGIASYGWDFGDGSTATGSTPTHTYGSPGQYTATLTVTDDAGNTATDTVTISVEDTTTPTADAGSNQTVDNGTAVTFDATGSSDNVGVVSYEWAFGDGSTETGSTLTHTYGGPGTYTAVLTVTDDANNTDTDSVTVTVEDQATDDSDGGSTGGGGGTGGTSGDGGTGGGGSTDDASTDTESEDETNNSTSSSVLRESQAEIEMDSETGQAKAMFGDESSVESVTINSHSVEGSVNVTELAREPVSTGPAPGSSVSVMEINVPENAADTPGTVRTRVSRERLESVAAGPEDLRISRHVDGQWRGLDTEVVETTDERVVLKAETPGFSYFTVSAVGEPTAVIDAPERVDVGDELTLSASDSATEYGEITTYEWKVGEANLSGESAAFTFSEPGEITVTLTVESDKGETDSTTHTVVVGDPESGVDDTGSSDPGETGSSDTGNGSDGTSSEGGPGATTDETPGFGTVSALVSLLAAALLAVRSRDV